VGRAKLDMGKAREIRRLHSEEGVSGRELAKRYGVEASTITQLLRGVTWREPPLARRPVWRRKPLRALSDEEVAEIKRLRRSSGLSHIRIAFIVGVSEDTVRKVLKSP
jgi:DNA-binding transcriptional regulator YiaG